MGSLTHMRMAEGGVCLKIEVGSLDALFRYLRLSFVVPQYADLIMLSRAAFLPMKVSLFINNTSYVIRLNIATLLFDF